MLFQPSGAMVSCPLAMTDGAAYTLKAIKSDPATRELWHPELDLALDCLTSKDPRIAWTSGQWMTEKRGGSDVTGSTDTFAIEEKD